MTGAASMMKPGLQLALGQHLAMTPQLRQAIRLLQFSAVELKGEIDAALETNMML
jgi:RNA polymerase sigma-54 factor